MKWETLPLASLGTIQTGSTPSTTEARFWNGDVPFVTPSELEQRLPITLTPRTLTEAGSQEGRMLQEGAVMVCCIGSLGKIGIAGRALVTNQQINSVEFDTKRVYPKYGYYACQLLKPNLISMAPATTVPIVNKSKFGQLEIPVPPLPEQVRIATILDKADALRVKRREALAQLDSLTQAIFIEMFGDPITNPKGLPRKSIGNIGKVITGNTPPRANPANYGDTIEWIKSDNINTPHYYLTRAEEGLSAQGKSISRTAPAGAILVTCIAGSPDCIGNSAMADREVAFNQQINAFLPESGDSHFYYAQIIVGKKLIQDASTKSMKGMVSKGRFEKIMLIVPPDDLQREFAQKVSSVDKLKDIQLVSLVELDNLFATLQHRAFRGEL